MTIDELKERQSWSRKIYPDILGVFCNTGNEYPDIVKFVNTLRNTDGYNIQIIRPKLTPRQVCEQYGFPLVSKEISHSIHQIRSNPTCATSLHILDDSNKYKLSYKWRYLINEVYDTHDICCNKLKKEPCKEFEQKTHRHPIIGVMASESMLRTAQYLRAGQCNVFSENGRTISRPLSIWLDDDIWAYIDKYSLPISEIYRKGAYRTGCVGCGFGCQFTDDNRFELLYNTHPKLYDMIMSYTNNGVTYREVLRKMLSVNNRYLPDEINKLF